MATSKRATIAVMLLTLHYLVFARKCHYNDYCKSKMFASKTMYDVVRGDIRDVTLHTSLQGCTPQALWSLNRHGTRRAGNSATEDMRKASQLLPDIVAAHRVGYGELCSQDVENLQAWTWDPEQETTQSYLVEAGYHELYDMGKRFRERYLELITEHDTDKYYFRATDTQRTNLSAIAFVEGLFDLKEHSNQYIDDARPGNDEVIQPYDMCTKWKNEVRNSDESRIEMNKYKADADYQRVIQKVQRRTGIDHQLDADEIFAFYELCRFQKSWFPKDVSPWCAFFDNEDIAIIEYLDDLRHFYRNGYATNLTSQLGAMTTKNLLEVFEEAVNENKEKVVAYFTHDTMLEMTFCALGLFDDGHNLTAKDRNPTRKWKTSFIATFAVNLIATLYKCPDKSNYVSFLVNESPIDMPGCADGSVCTWSEFQSRFQQFRDANLDFCYTSRAPISSKDTDD